MNFGSLPEAPARITSARMVDVPPPDPKTPPGTGTAVLAASPLKQYCQVLGYVAPQNRFELRLPLLSQWNQKFHLRACGGFCGAVNGNACNPSLARGYASMTGNGGHDGGPGFFDGVWAANSPDLQEDFAWRHNHVIHGDKDSTVPFNQSEILAAELNKGGLVVNFIRVPGGGHDPAILDLTAVVDWYERHLRGARN